MSQRTPEPERPPEQEQLSRTLLESLRAAAQSLEGLSTTFAVSGIVAVVLGLILLVLTEDLRLYSYILLGGGGVSLLLSMSISFQTVSQAVIGRRGRYSTNTAVMVVTFIGIVAVINFLAFENPSRKDVTATEQFSLSPRTQELLKNLDVKVDVKAFFRDPAASLREKQGEDFTDDMLQKFDVRSGKFSYEFIDPVKEPLIASVYGVTDFGTVVFEAADPETGAPKVHSVVVSAFLEQDFVTALLIVTGQQQKRVYFLTDHLEKSIADIAPESVDGFGRAALGVRTENYATSTINISLEGDRELLFDTETVTMLVVAAPKNDLVDGEAEILDRYLKSGGKMLFLLEPDTPESFKQFLARWGVVVEQGHIVDESSLGDNKSIALLRSDQYFGQFGQIPEPFNTFVGISQLTSKLGRTYYPGIASLRPAEDGVLFFPAVASRAGDESEVAEEDGGDLVEDLEALKINAMGTALGFTSPNSWLVQDPTSNTPDKDLDPRGPFFPAVAIRAIGPVDEDLALDGEQLVAAFSGRPIEVDGELRKLASLVVFGDSDFVSNRYFGEVDNENFFLNSVNWLVGDETLEGIRPKLSVLRQLFLTRNEHNFMRYSSWFLLPALMALTGAFVWWRRR